MVVWFRHIWTQHFLNMWLNMLEHWNHQTKKSVLRGGVWSPISPWWTEYRQQSEPPPRIPPLPEDILVNLVHSCAFVYCGVRIPGKRGWVRLTWQWTILIVNGHSSTNGPGSYIYSAYLDYQKSRRICIVSYGPYRGHRDQPAWVTPPNSGEGDFLLGMCDVRNLCQFRGWYVESKCQYVSGGMIKTSLHLHRKRLLVGGILSS